MTTPLSPAAQAVIDASWGGIPCVLRDPYVVHCEQMAAAIRAATDQELPEERECESGKDSGAWAEAQRIRRRFLAIATELEAVNA